MARADSPNNQAAAIAKRWLADTLAGYGPAAARAFERQADPFANPVGHALHTALPAAVESLLAGQSAQEVTACLDDVIRIRAVQEFSPSQAVGFVFLLKTYSEGSLQFPHGSFCDRVDQVALAAFDRYVEHRQRVAEVRINEARRLAGRYAGRSGRSEQSGTTLDASDGSVDDAGSEISIAARGDCP